MGVSLLTGACFTVGILVVLFVNDVYEERSYEEDVWVDTPENVFIENHAPKENSPRFAVVGEIRNESEHEWESLSVELEIYAGSALMNTCRNSFQYIPARSSKPFEVGCYDVSGSGLPDNVRYEIEVTSGRR